MNKAVVVCLLLVFVFPGKASKQGMSRKSADVELRLSTSPKLNELFTVRAKIIGKKGLEEYAYFFSTYEFRVVFSTHPEGAIKIIDKNEVYIPELRNGWTKEVKCRMQIVKPLTNVNILCRLYPLSDRVTQVADVIELYLLDSLTGQYGTREEWLKKSVSVLWKYNNIEPQWLTEPDQAFELSNRKIVQEMRKFEPALSDSEALCLHQDNYLLIINAIGDSNATDSERIEHLLKTGWLEAQRAGAEAKEEWFNEFMRKNRGKWGGESKFNFFRGNNSIDSDFSNGNNPSPKERVTTTFIGQWVYQDHLYNKDNGLLWSYSVKPVKTAEVGIRAYWIGQGAIWVGWGSTNDSGNFTIQTELIPSGATNVKAYPILFTWGPERYNELIKVSDPVPLASTWRNPRDTTIWFLDRAGSPPANSVAPGTTCDFGICYPDTATATNTQPRSGSVNILETYLHARTFMSPPPTWPLRIL